MITLQEIKQNESIKALVRAGNRYLETLGYTDHGPRHLGYVSRTASGILKSLGYSEREVELAAIAGQQPLVTKARKSSTATITAQTALFCSFPCCGKSAWISKT